MRGNLLMFKFILLGEGLFVIFLLLKSLEGFIVLVKINGLKIKGINNSLIFGYFLMI